MCMGADIREEMMPTLAAGYDKNGQHASLSDSDWSGWGWAGPAGGWWVTTGDLARLMITLQSSAAVYKGTIEKLMLWDRGPLFDEGDENESYTKSLHAGMGLELSPPSSSKKWYGKAGGIAGYTSYIRIWPNAQDPEKSIGVALMCNRAGVGDEMLEQIRTYVAAEDNYTGGLDQGGGKGGVPAVRQQVARYAVDGRLDEEGAMRLIRDLGQSKDGEVILDAAARGDWDTAAALVLRRYNR